MRLASIVALAVVCTSSGTSCSYHTAGTVVYDPDGVKSQLIRVYWGGPYRYLEVISPDILRMLGSPDREPNFRDEYSWQADLKGTILRIELTDATAEVWTREDGETVHSSIGLVNGRTMHRDHQMWKDR